MSEPAPRPVDIRYHSRSRVLEVLFADDTRFELPAGYLRVHARDTAGDEPPAPADMPADKDGVAIARIAPLAGGAIGLHFDDGHDSGVYTWAYLHRLGAEQDALTRRYRARSASA